MISTLLAACMIFVIAVVMLCVCAFVVLIAARLLHGFWKFWQDRNDG